MTNSNKLADALRNIVNMLREHPAMQGREYVGLGIAANNALREYDAALAEHDAQPAPAPVQVDEQECECCGGFGWIDETLGGYAFSNPKARCPDCDGRGYYLPAHPPAPAADGVGELPPLPEPAYGNAYSGGQVRSYARAAIAALRQPVPDAVWELPGKWRADKHDDAHSTSLWDQGYSQANKDCADDLESALASQQESRNGK